MATTTDYLNQLQADKQVLVDNLVAKGVEATNDETFTTLAPKVANIPSSDSSEPMFTGSYDREGLKTIGWTDEEIDYYNKYGVQWNAESNDSFKLTEKELAGNATNSTRFLPKTTSLKSFSSFRNLLAIPKIDTSNRATAGNMFYYCISLTTIPQLDTSNVGTMTNMFTHCYSLAAIPQLNTSNATEMNSMFNYCCSLTTIPQLDTSNVTNMDSMFNSCYSLKTIPQLNTSKVKNMNYMFENCFSLKTIPQLDASNITTILYIFSRCESLINLGGFLNLGKAYSTTQSANYSNYKLDLSSCLNLTHDSLMNVINNLYDIASINVQPQQLTLGSTNKAKLTEEEIAIATSKGWVVS